MTRKALIVGGGIAGMSSAIMLRRSGWSVDLLEMDPEWRVQGAGITITGPTLRALRAVGVLDEVMTCGAAWAGGEVYDAAGRPLAILETPVLEEGIPATAGVMRPALHAVLSARTREAGIRVRLGATAHRIVPEGEAVTVHASDGESGVFDLVVGADGIFSSVRRMLWPEAPEPFFTGQACWRLVAKRPEGFTRSHFYMGADNKLGFNPVSPSELYMFLLQHAPGDPWVPLQEQAARLHDLMDGFGGIVPQVRASVLQNSTINYRPLKVFFLDRPWRKGRVVLIGDAVHATTPHLASGAGMAVEDAVVLAQELDQADVGPALDRFTDRRFDRCRAVIENSIRLGELEMTHGSPQEHRDLMAASIAALRQPI